MRYCWVLVPLMLGACNSDEYIEPVEVVVKTNFIEGENLWQAGFSDYPVDDKDIFQLVTGIKEIPGQTDKKGYLLGGMNRSDDLFMYLKREVTGLAPNTRYQITVEVDFWSEVGNVCFGIGGSPGESVYVKAGASEQEPKQDEYYMNIDIGHQSQDGSDAKVIGNISIDGLSCDGGEFASKQVKLSTDAEMEVVSSPTGEVWVLVGSDSGFEGLTHLYYESVNFKLTPSS